MPEIGRPVSQQEDQYRQVTMAPKALSNRKDTPGSKAKDDERIVNRATGRKAESIYSDKPKNQMGKDEFLKLLTFQLQNQDPMNPMDQGKMTGELAQFSQLEQLSNLNSKFDKVQQNQMVQDKFYAASFVGKRVVTSGSSIKVTEEGGSADVLFKLEGDAKKVMIRILDEKNQTVGEIWKDNMSGGSQQVTWDGVTLDNQPAAKGNYKAQVRAWDAQNVEVGARTEATGMVQSVSFDEGEPVLTVDGQKVYLRDVNSFHTDDAVGAKKMPAAPGQKNTLSLPQGSLSPQASPAQAANAYNASAGIYD